MNFLSIFHHIEGGAIEAGKIALIGAAAAEPIVNLLNPAFGAIFSFAVTTVVAAEQKYTADKAGATKKQMFMDQVTNALPLVQMILAAEGKQVNSPAILNMFSAAADSIVALLNSLASTNLVTTSATATPAV